MKYTTCENFLSSYQILIKQFVAEKLLLAHAPLNGVIEITVHGPDRSRSCSSIAGAVKQEPIATLLPTVAVQFTCICLSNIKEKDN